MTDEQFTQLSELIKTQNEMIARIGLILVRLTWLMLTVLFVLILILIWTIW
jgi:preprotein translocase subunit SecG